MVASCQCIFSGKFLFLLRWPDCRKILLTVETWGYRKLGKLVGQGGRSVVRHNIEVNVSQCVVLAMLDIWTCYDMPMCHNVPFAAGWLQLF